MGVLSGRLQADLLERESDQLRIADLEKNLEKSAFLGSTITTLRHEYGAGGLTYSVNGGKVLRV